jgi:hypothetical protein
MLAKHSLSKTVQVTRMGRPNLVTNCHGLVIEFGCHLTVMIEYDRQLPALAQHLNDPCCCCCMQSFSLLPGMCSSSLLRRWCAYLLLANSRFQKGDPQMRHYRQLLSW